MSKPIVRGIDLFSGPGGLTLGLKAAGFHPLCSVEINHDAVATYRGHTPDCDHHCDDIRMVDLTKYRGAAEILYGGPPCQPFSTGGLRQGKHDHRDMIPAFLAAIETTRPQVVLMENVPGLLVEDRRPYFNRVLEELGRLGYRPAWRLLSAADYGVPQKRRRLFVVAFRDRVFRFPRPTHGPEGFLPYVPAGSLVKAEPLGEPPNCPVWYAPVVDLRPSPYAGHVFQGGGRPINLGVPCHTVYASAGGNKTHWIDTLNIVPEYHAHLLAGGRTREGIVPGARRLTIEESSLIQTFPATLRLAGSRSSQYKQVGDAVPPRLAETLGRAIRAQLLGEAVRDDSYYAAVEVEPMLF